jgi:hypothetical protein
MTIRRSAAIIAFASALSLGSLVPGAAADQTRAVHTVNCNRDQTIANALKRADPGDTIRVTGTCVERIVIGDGSTAELTDVTVKRNLAGLDIFTGSAAVLRGTIVLQNNTANGAEINGLSVLEIRGAHVQASDNGGVGIIAGSGQLALFGFPSTAGSTLTASGNGFAGLVIASSQLTAFPRCKITVANNAIGLFVVSSFVAVVDGNAEFVAENNQIGLSRAIAPSPTVAPCATLHRPWYSVSLKRSPRGDA